MPTPTTFAVAPFEHYMLADDFDRYSMTANIRFWFDGYFDRPTFEAALRLVLPEHPLFQVFLRGQTSDRTKNLRWYHPGHVTMPYIYWAREPFETSGKGLTFPQGDQRIHLDREIGIRLFVREHEGKTELTISFHHATSDGKGVFNFGEDLMAAYEELKGGRPRRPRLGQELLRERAFFGLTPRERLMRMWRDMIVLWKFFTMIPATLAATVGGRPIRRDAPKNSDIFCVVRRKIPKEVIAKTRQTAKISNSTLNDILLRDLFMTLGAWNHLAGVRGTGTRVTVAVPVCMRGAKFQQTPASNYVSMHVLHVPNSVLQDPGKLLGHIHKIMRFVKSFEMGHTLVVFAMLAGKIKGGLVNFFRIPLSRATAGLTNLGIPYSDSPLRDGPGPVRFAGMTLTGVETLPPIRDRTRICLSINSYDGDLRVTMRYDDTVFDQAAADKLIDKFVERVGMTAAESELVVAKEPALAGTILPSQAPS